MPNKYIDVRINEERFCTEGIAEFSLLNMDALNLDCDEFICHKCGIHIEDWKRIKIDPDDGEKELCEYTFKHCPECGAKIIIHKSCEFCRWHLQDGTCFNKHRPKPTTHRESSCWNWEERE